MRARLISLLAVGAMALAGCGGSNAGHAPSGSLGINDINPQPRDNVRDGGDLRLPMSLFPSNFNYNQVDGPGADVKNIETAVLPWLFPATADGGERLNTDYLTSAAVTSTSPQVVTYTINPKATWSDGTPISWRDFEAEWKALNGTDPAYQVAGTAGYDQIGSVTRGADDKQAVVTFTKPFGEWKLLFSPLTPASLNSTPDAFNGAWRTGIPVTAGPFSVQAIDQTAQTVVLARNPGWWGTPPKLDRVLFKAYATSAMPDSLANNELDAHGIGGIVDLLRRAQQIPGVAIRNAPGRFAYNVTLNGAPTSPLADLRLRQAIAQGINRQEIAKRQLSMIVPDASPDGSHFFAPGTKEYQDNSDALPFDAAKAQQTLDSLGWTRPAPDAPRTKGGTPLSLRLVYAIDPSNQEMAKTLQNQLAKIGVTLELTQVDGNQLFPTYVNRGNFDLALFGWRSTAFPFSDGAGIFQQPLGDNVRQNYGRVGSPEIDALIAQTLGELDDTKRAALGNQADRLIWQQAHSVILFAVPGVTAVRANVANYGAQGFADIDFVNAGFVK